VDEEVSVSIDDVLRDEDDQPLGLERTISRAEFAQLTQDLVMRTFKVCDEALQQSDLTVRDLDGVILVGGPTRLPVIREAVQHYFQQEPRVDVDPDEVVSMGAAIHAASLVGEAQDSMLLDVTPLDLRIGVAGGLAEPVIDRNTPVPIEQTRTFTTAQDHQESVRIRVYQGDYRQAEDNALLGQFEFSGFEKGPRSEVKIDVTFEIDADGIVNVTAADQRTGQEASTQITLSSGLAEEQIETIIQQDVAGRVATAGLEETPPTTGFVDGTMGDGSDDGAEDFFASGNDEIELLSDTDSEELELIDDDELIHLTEEAELPAADAITLDARAGEDEDFFDYSANDLSSADLNVDLESPDSGNEER
jgi:molecular chaperone DnaK